MPRCLHGGCCCTGTDDQGKYWGDQAKQEIEDLENESEDETWHNEDETEIENGDVTGNGTGDGTDSNGGGGNGGHGGGGPEDTIGRISLASGGGGGTGGKGKWADTVCLVYVFKLTLFLPLPHFPHAHSARLPH